METELEIIGKKQYRCCSAVAKMRATMITAMHHLCFPQPLLVDPKRTRRESWKTTTRVTRGHTRLHDEMGEEAEVAASNTRRIRLPAARARIGSTYGRLRDDAEPALPDESAGPPPGARIYPGPNELDWSCPTSSLPTRVPRLPAEVTEVGFGLD